MCERTCLPPIMLVHLSASHNFECSHCASTMHPSDRTAKQRMRVRDDSCSLARYYSADRCSFSIGMKPGQSCDAPSTILSHTKTVSRRRPLARNLNVTVEAATRTVGRCRLVFHFCNFQKSYSVLLFFLRFSPSSPDLLEYVGDSSDQQQLAAAASNDE